MSDPMAQRWTGLFSDLQAQSKQATPSLYQTSLTVTSSTPPVTSPRLRDLALAVCGKTQFSATRCPDHPYGGRT